MNKTTQFFSLALLLMDHNLLNILLGLVGRAQRALSLEFLLIPSGFISFPSNSSSSASFILKVDILDFGDLRPETLHWSSAALVVVVLNGGGGLEGSIP